MPRSTRKMPGSTPCPHGQTGTSLDAKLELLWRDMTIKLGSMIFIATGVLIAAIRLMGHS